MKALILVVLVIVVVATVAYFVWSGAENQRADGERVAVYTRVMAYCDLSGGSDCMRSAGMLMNTRGAEITACHRLSPDANGPFRSCLRASGITP